jgi:Fungal N-terminal domain of STAND proteins
MAEVIAIASSIAGLLSLALEANRQISAVSDAFRNGSSTLRSIVDELSGLATVLQELRSCLSSSSSRSSFSQAVQQSNLEALVRSVEKHIWSINEGLRKSGLSDLQKSKQKWHTWRLLGVEKELQKHLTSLQREKLALILALSSLSL